MLRRCRSYRLSFDEFLWFANKSVAACLANRLPRLLSLCQLDDVDAVVMVPNCPVCHQSTALASAHLEAAGIPTVIMGCTKDIIEYVGAPRFLFNDLPLGNGAGLPHDQASQDLVAGWQPICWLPLKRRAQHSNLP